MSQNFGEPQLTSVDTSKRAIGEWSHRTKHSTLCEKFGSDQRRSGFCQTKVRAATEHSDYIHAVITIPHLFRKLHEKSKNGNPYAVYRKVQFH